MKQLFTFVFLFVIVLTSCVNKDKNSISPTDEFQATLSEADTLQMLHLGDSCMMLLQQKNIDGALGMLYEYDDSTNQVLPLSESTQKRYARLFNLFPVYSFSRVAYTFMLEGLNDIKYNVIFAAEDHPEVNGVSKTSFMFNPVKIDGKWYLTVKRGDQEFAR